MPGGNIIKREWWKFYNAKDYNVDGLVFITADTGIKDKDTSDPSVFAAWHAGPRYLDLIGLERGRWAFPELKRRLHAFYQKHAERFGCNAVYIEDAASGDPLAHDLGEIGIPVTLWKPGDYQYPPDKLGRVRMSLWFIEGGRVRLPDDAPEITGPFVDECSAFTGQKSDTDDQVDVATMACSVCKWKGGFYDVQVAA